MIAETKWTFCVCRPVSLSEANRGVRNQNSNFVSWFCFKIQGKLPHVEFPNGRQLMCLISGKQWSPGLDLLRQDGKVVSTGCAWGAKYYCVCAQLCPTFCDLMDSGPPGFSIHGIFQATALEWVAIFYSRWSSWPRDQTHVSCVSCMWILYHCHLGSPSLKT